MKGRSEKIAVAFGLKATVIPKPIRIFSLRMCGDCHNAMKRMRELFMWLAIILSTQLASLQLIC
jgi:hypothetical protein